MLSLGSRATSVGAVGVAREFDRLARGELENLLESASNVEKDILALLVGSALSTSNISISAARDALTNSTSPNTDTEESFTDVDNNSHDLTILLFLEGLSNGSHHHLQPQSVDINVALVFVLVRPLATVLVLGIFPFGADTGLEQVVIGLQGQLGDGSDIVLQVLSV